MIFTNQALALFPPSLGQAIAQTQRDRDELVEEICCRIGRPPVLLTQENVYPAACRAVLPDDLDYLLERATRASVYAAADQIRQGYLQTAGGCRVGLCGCAYGQAAGQIDGIRQLSSVSVRIPHAVPGCADALVPQLMKDGFCSTLILSPPGGGKTTLASLVARFFDTTEGRILIGNKDVKEISSRQLMDMVSFVFQDSKLLKTSILENVRMGKKEATREEVMQALKEAQCEDIIAKLPDGIDTVIGSSGTYVSGGEAQRLSIARAMLKNAPILILDEATAFADPDNEAKVQEAFSRLSKGKTVIMIAHRLSSIVDADRICVLKDGSIAEEGTHETLLQKNGVYAHMWEEYNKSVQWKVGA